MLTRGLVVLILGIALLSGAAWAENDIYFVAYNHHIKKGEVELMIMTDFTEPAERTEDTGFYMSNMLELEYGVTDQWATELMLEGFLDLTRGFGKFTGFRWENRCRLHREKNRGWCAAGSNAPAAHRYRIPHPSLLPVSAQADGSTAEAMAILIRSPGRNG